MTKERAKQIGRKGGLRKGGLKGGKSRAAVLTPEQRKEIAQHAARARWAKKS